MVHCAGEQEVVPRFGDIDGAGEHAGETGDEVPAGAGGAEGYRDCLRGTKTLTTKNTKFSKEKPKTDNH